MNREGWFVIGVVAALVFGLARNWLADWMSIGCLAVLMAVGETTGSPLLPTPKLAVSEFGERVLVMLGQAELRLQSTACGMVEADVEAAR